MNHALMKIWHIETSVTLCALYHQVCNYCVTLTCDVAKGLSNRLQSIISIFNTLCMSKAKALRDYRCDIKKCASDYCNSLQQ